MDSWGFRFAIIKYVRHWVENRTGIFDSYFFYPDGRNVPVDVPFGKRVKVTFEIEDDPEAEIRKGFREAADAH